MSWLYMKVKVRAQTVVRFFWSEVPALAPAAFLLPEASIGPSQTSAKCYYQLSNKVRRSTSLPPLQTNSKAKATAT